jgi:hypothetical protein
MSSKPVNIFISYSHLDVGYKDQLQIFMAPLLRNGKLSYWSDEKIKLGAKWDVEIRRAFDESQIILLLISADFLNSKYIMEQELEWARQKHERNEAIIFPIFIRQCYLGESADITCYQGAPSYEKPVSSFEDKDEAYTIIVKKISERLKDLPNFNESQFKHEALRYKADHITEQVNKLSRTKNIYLSVGSDTVERNAIFSELSRKREWENWPYTIVPSPDEALAMEGLPADELHRKVQKYLDDSLFSIHLVAGVDSAASEIVKIQYELARQRCSRSSFRCIVAIHDRESEEVLFTKGGEDYATNPSIEKVSGSSRDVIVSHILKHVNESNARISALKKKARSLNNKETVFLLYDSVDEDNLTRDQLKFELESEGVDVSPNLVHNYTDDDYNIRKYEADQVQECDGVVIFYANAGHNWCKIRQDFILKEKVRIRGVCVDEPEVQKKVLRNVRRTQFQVMNEEKQLKTDVREYVERLRSDE